ncbi:MAG: hypothetical protein HKN02_01220, partial [Rhodobacteraceae bacterium]|nr:hypothetical protein [Paracoccaceae bacterium]
DKSRPQNAQDRAATTETSRSCFEAGDGTTRSELRPSANPVEKQEIDSGVIECSERVQAFLLSGFSRTLRCRKEFSEFAEVLGGRHGSILSPTVYRPSSDWKVKGSGGCFDPRLRPDANSTEIRIPA